MSHKYICAYRYGNKYCYQLCLACKGYLTNHIKKPIEPNKNSCCGDSCPNCVWSVYFDELKKYNTEVNQSIHDTILYFKQKEEQKIQEKEDIIPKKISIF